MSIVVTPFILMFYLPRSAAAIVDFVREHSTHIDGLGHICSFALFDFERHGDPIYSALHSGGVSGGGSSSSGGSGGAVVSPSSARGGGFIRGKMEKSFIGFAEAHPDWRPDLAGREMLESLSLSKYDDGSGGDDAKGGTQASASGAGFSGAEGSGQAAPSVSTSAASAAAAIGRRPPLRRSNSGFGRTVRTSSIDDSAAAEGGHSSGGAHDDESWQWRLERAAETRHRHG